MAYTQIGIGAVANDNTGDPIRDAFEKVNFVLDALDLNFAISSTLVIGDDPANIGTPAGFENTISSGDGTDDNITIAPDGSGDTQGRVVLDGSTTRLVTALRTPPSNVGVAGDTLGDFRIDAGFIYVCVRDFDSGADAWLSVAVATF